MTERNPPERCRRRTQVQRYLFLVLEGARLEAGGLRVPLGDAAWLQIGRGPARALVAGDDGAQVLEVPDPRMSGTHARIMRIAGTFTLQDAGSTNGTLVNGEPIATHVLRDGDVLELGQTIFLYRELEAETLGRARSLDSRTAAVPAPGFATLDPDLALRLELLSRVAPSSLSILLLGETGTGKEVLAHGLHLLSRRPGPFVAVNCGAIPQNLVESQLFGHVRGAFSGALRDEPGLVRSAQHGTLLLDEIGDLPLGSQAALLRVLQEGEVRPVGSTHTVKVDVRIVAATHMPLAGLIERGAFRRDLYARLAGYTFLPAPLRERRMDLGLLVAALLSAGKLGARRGIQLQGDAGRALVRHDWPMNVRELEQCLRAACMLSDDGVITAEDLRSALFAAGVAATPPPPGALACTVVPSFRVDQRARLVALLAEHHGNLSAVARAMQTSRTQVYRLMERYKVSDGP
ncbi:MAG TPA: sigma 54-interacting transcriptional regulator [Kofleriaceae bacterium]